MFILENPNRHLKPIKAWLERPEDLDPVCLAQAQNLANIPFLHQWVALMPDTHQGYGMPIGGVAALKDVVIPNAVGVDIGCGVAFVETDIPAEALTPALGRKLIEQIMQRIPVGFKHQDKRQQAQGIETYLEEKRALLKPNVILYRELEAVFFQLGTLGSGNHFIEVQQNDQGRICLMIHSGSRNFGLKIANYFNDRAKEVSKKHGWQAHVRNQLSILPVDSESGRAYLEWMHVALLFAEENRRQMMATLKDIFHDAFKGMKTMNALNVHHNYASLETHYGESVWVHRKGAIRAEAGEIGLIPGAMGMESFLVKGLGNPEAFCSCSHGAGRHISRRQAMKEIDKERVFRDLEERGVLVGTPDRAGLVDESRFVYKDIRSVMACQMDLVEILGTMRSMLVVKG